MPELLVVVGAEASLLLLVGVMTLYAKQMDVLSGRSFEQSVVPPAGDRRPTQSLLRRARGFLRLIDRWFEFVRTNRLKLGRRSDRAKTQQSRRRRMPRTLPWVGTPPRPSVSGLPTLPAAKRPPGPVAAPALTHSRPAPHA